MAKDLWEAKHRPHAQELITWLLSVRVGDGFPLDEVNEIAFTELVSLTRSYYRERLTVGLVVRILGRMHLEGKVAVSEFETIYHEVAKDEATTARTQYASWCFFLPFEMTINSDVPKPRRVRVLGYDFSFLSKIAVQRRLGNDIFTDKKLLRLVGVPRAGRPRIPDVFLSVSVEAASWKTAWEQVSPAFDALRGLIEFTFGYGSARQRFGRYRESPLRRIPHPLWMLAQRSGQAPEGLTFITEDLPPKKLFALTREGFQALRSGTKLIAEETDEKSIRSLIADCLRLYSLAMDAVMPYNRFLHLWQLAEAIARTETVGGKTEETVKRIAWHGEKLGLRASGYRATLAVYADKRNKIVHRGIHEIQDHDVNIFKRVCEVALQWLANQHALLPTKEHLDHFYSLRDAPPSKLEAIQEVTNYVKKEREK